MIHYYLTNLAQLPTTAHLTTAHLTQLARQVRGSFDDDYHIVAVAGQGAEQPPVAAEGVHVYAPCVGNSPSQLAALKK